MAKPNSKRKTEESEIVDGADHGEEPDNKVSLTSTLHI